MASLALISLIARPPPPPPNPHRCTRATRSLTTTSTSRRLRCAPPASRVRRAGAGVPWCLGQGAVPFSAAVHASRQAAPSCVPAALHRSHTLLLTWAFSARLPLPAGADLSNLLNEAAILTGRRNKEGISQREIDDSIDRIVAGAPCCCCVRHGAWQKTPRPAQLAPWLLPLAFLRLCSIWWAIISPPAPMHCSPGMHPTRSVPRRHGGHPHD